MRRGIAIVGCVSVLVATSSCGGGEPTGSSAPIPHGGRLRVIVDTEPTTVPSDLGPVTGTLGVSERGCVDLDGAVLLLTVPGRVSRDRRSLEVDDYGTFDIGSRVTLTASRTVYPPQPADSDIAPCAGTSSLPVLIVFRKGLQPAPVR